nr:hypothetical protein [Mycolicibacterium sp. CH28]
MSLLLLLGWGWAEAGRKRPLLEWRRKKKARLLSSYSNNSNNPQRGTDQLRGAW